MASAADDKIPSGKNVDQVLWKRHDTFNICVLPLIFITNLYYLFTRPHNDIESFTYQVQFFVFLTYITIDVLWLILYPKSVPAPTFIIVHHIICIICWTIPYYWDATYADVSTELCVVEVNTWILTLRRHWKGEIASPVLEALFFTSWIGIRNVYYPYILWRTFPRYLEHCQRKGGYINDGLFFFVLLVFMNYLNSKWTWDLFKSKFFKKLKDKE